MFWCNDHAVIWNMSQSKSYNSGVQTLILANSFECLPRFSLLKLLPPTTDSLFKLASVKETSDSMYLLEYNLWNGKKSILHGSCGSGVIGKIEYDTAICFASDLWPYSASLERQMSIMAWFCHLNNYSVALVMYIHVYYNNRADKINLNMLGLFNPINFLKKLKILLSVVA